MNKNVKILETALFISLTITFVIANTYINGGNISNNGYYILSLWIILAFVVIIINSFKIKNLNKSECLAIGFRYSFIPKMVIYIYTVILILLGLTDKEYFSSNLQTFINGLTAIAVFYLVGNKALKVSIYAVIAAYLILLLKCLFSGNSLEFNDLAFSVGYIVIYMINVRKKWRLKVLFVDLIILIMILLAGKRIGIFALIIAVLWLKISSKFDKKMYKNIMIISATLISTIALIFIAFTLSPQWMKQIDSLGINLSGRNYYYSVMSDHAHFGIDFIGLGRNACQYIISHEYQYFHIGNIHSDILRMYIECGMVLFIIWLGYYLYIEPFIILKSYGTKAACFLFSITIYTFIVYFTDNTELYLMNNYFYILTFLTFLYSEKSNLKIDI